jgi:hypothetical protein
MRRSSRKETNLVDDHNTSSLHAFRPVDDLIVANSRPCERHSDTEEVRIAWRGNIHAGLLAVASPHLLPSDSAQTRTTPAGMAELRHKQQHNHSRLSSRIVKGVCGPGLYVGARSRAEKKCRTKCGASRRADWAQNRRTVSIAVFAT